TACCFFFQAEDGIRDDLVTGVQTCALPILVMDLGVASHAGIVTDGDARLRVAGLAIIFERLVNGRQCARRPHLVGMEAGLDRRRSEERRVGKEWRARGWREAYSTK